VQPLKRHRHRSAADEFKVKDDKVVRMRQYINLYKPNVPSNIESPERIIKTQIHKAIETNNGKNQARSPHKNRVYINLIYYAII